MRRIFRLKQVMTMTGLGRSCIYAVVAEARFPASVKLGPRAVGWVEQEIEDWIEARIAERDEG
jgi:prophage regulatory protein